MESMSQAQSGYPSWAVTSNNRPTSSTSTNGYNKTNDYNSNTADDSENSLFKQLGMQDAPETNYNSSVPGTMLNSSGLSRENQSKVIQERINQVEKHFGELCQHFGGYARRLSKLRDNGDELAKSVMSYADQERRNPTTKVALKEFTEHFSGIQDYRETEIKRIESKVVLPLSNYGTACKQAKVTMKTAFSARDKELKVRKKLDTTREKNPSNRQQISQAETRLQKASVDASRTSKHLEEEIDLFEKKKLEDLKSVLQNFVNIELLFHSKALEIYTQCYQSLSVMDEAEDLEEFRNSLRPPTAQSRLQMQNSTSRGSLAASKNSLTTSRNSLNGTQQYAGSAGRPPSASHSAGKRQSQNPGDTMTTTGSRSMYTEDDEDDDDEDDDEDDDDDDDDEDYSEEYDEYNRHRQGYTQQPSQRQHQQQQQQAVLRRK